MRIYCINTTVILNDQTINMLITASCTTDFLNELKKLKTLEYSRKYSQHFN